MIIVALILTVLYLYQENVALKKEITDGCQNFSDPHMTNTRRVIGEKVRTDMIAELEREIEADNLAVNAYATLYPYLSYTYEVRQIPDSNDHQYDND